MYVFFLFHKHQHIIIFTQIHTKYLLKKIRIRSSIYDKSKQLSSFFLIFCLSYLYSALCFTIYKYAVHVEQFKNFFLLLLHIALYISVLVILWNVFLYKICLRFKYSFCCIVYNICITFGSIATLPLYFTSMGSISKLNHMIFSNLIYNYDGLFCDCDSLYKRIPLTFHIELPNWKRDCKTYQNKSRWTYPPTHHNHKYIHVKN